MIALRTTADLVVLATAIFSRAQGRISIKVVDPSGAAVPGATIEVDSSPEPAYAGMVSIANGLGEATLNLPQGEYRLRVCAPGFACWIRTELTDNSDQKIVAELQIRMVSGPVMVMVILPEMPLVAPQLPLLSLQPLQNLPLFPARLRKRKL